MDVAHSACPHHFYHVYVGAEVVVSCARLFCVCEEECQRSRVNGSTADGTLQSSPQIQGRKEPAWQEGHPSSRDPQEEQDSSRPEEPFLS